MLRDINESLSVNLRPASDRSSGAGSALDLVRSSAFEMSTLSEQESFAINEIAQLLGLAREQKQLLIRQFLEYLMRHGLAQEGNVERQESDYLRQAFRVNGSPEVVEKMDRLLDQAPALRQLFAVIRQQMQQAESRLEQHWQEQSKEEVALEKAAAERESLTQQQLDAWERWLRQQAII